MSIDESRAAYRILDPAGFYSDDDTLYIMDADGNYPEIYFDGEPNEQMEPLNEVARVRLNAHLEMLDEHARLVAEKLGRPFISRPRNLDGALQLASEVERSRMSIMGNKDKVITTERVEAGSISETGKKRGRPVGSTHKVQLKPRAA